MENRVPMPGDAVRVVNVRDGGALLRDGQIGIMEGKVGEVRDEYLTIFAYSAFRGRSSGCSCDKDKPEYVSCSGGPGLFVPHEWLKDTGENQEVHFWRWRDMPRADGGEYYKLSVPLWEWNHGETCKRTA